MIDQVGRRGAEEYGLLRRLKVLELLNQDLQHSQIESASSSINQSSLEVWDVKGTVLPYRSLELSAKIALLKAWGALDACPTHGEDWSYIWCRSLDFNCRRPQCMALPVDSDGKVRDAVALPVDSVELRAFRTKIDELVESMVDSAEVPSEVQFPLRLVQVQSGEPLETEPSTIRKRMSPKRLEWPWPEHPCPHWLKSCLLEGDGRDELL